MRIQARVLQAACCLTGLIACSRHAMAQERTTISGIDAAAVAFSADGKWFAAGGKVSPAKRNPNDVQAVLGGADGVFKVFDADCKVVFQDIDNAMRVRSLAFCPKSNMLAVGYASRGVLSSAKLNPVILWNIDAKKKHLTLPSAYSYETLAFSPDGRWLATGSSLDSDKPGNRLATVTLWELPSGKPIQKWELKGQPTKFVGVVAFSADGNRLAFASHSQKLGPNEQYEGKDDVYVQVWNVRERKTISIALPHVSKISSLAFSPDGKLLAAGSMDHTVSVYDIGQDKLAKNFEAHSAGVWAVAFGPDSSLLFTGGSDPEKGSGSGTWKAWRISSGKLLHTARGHSTPTLALAVSHDGRRLVSGAIDGTVKLWMLPASLAKE